MKIDNKVFKTLIKYSESLVTKPINSFSHFHLSRATSDVVCNLLNRRSVFSRSRNTN